MRGIITYGAYVPFRRLDKAAITATFGSGGGKGTRTVASYDEDTTSMGVEAARVALRAAPDAATPGALTFATSAPAYADRTNANVIHAALRLDTEVLTLDVAGSTRGGVGALRLALEGAGTTLVVASDVRIGLPTSPDEANGGDGAVALLVGDDTAGAVLAECVSVASASEEFVDRWRAPGSTNSKLWEERFGEIEYVPLAERAFAAALKQADLSADQITVAIVTGPHPRAVRTVSSKLGVAKIAGDLAGVVGYTGAAHPGLLLATVLDEAEPGQLIALVNLSDGCDVVLLRTTEAIAGFTSQRPVAAQIAGGGTVPYGKYLSWRGMVTVEPPRRPEPARPSSSAAARNEDWKYGFVGSKDNVTGQILMPPARLAAGSDRIDDMSPVPMADAVGTVITYTIDRMAYSPSPPIVFAVVDFDGGGRMPIELTDCEPGEVEIGTRVEMTFRRLFTADGIHNYFWKARPIHG